MEWDEAYKQANEFIRVTYFDEKLDRWVNELLDYYYKWYELTIYDKELYYGCLQKNKYILEYIEKMNYRIIYMDDFSPYGEWVTLSKKFEYLTKEQLEKIENNIMLYKLIN